MKKKRKRPKPDRIPSSVSRLALLLVFLLSFVLTTKGQDLSEESSVPGIYPSIFNDIVSFRFHHATTRLDSLEATNGQAIHPLHPLFRNYIDFFPAYLDGDPAAYERIRSRFDERIEGLGESPESGPWSRYCRGEMYLQSALLHQQFRNYFHALRHLRKAKHILEEGAATHPDFRGFDKSLGLLHALGSAVPDRWRWAVRLLSGIEGDLRRGLREMERSAEAREEEFLFRDEAKAVYSFALFQLANEPERAVSVMEEIEYKPGESPLVLFLRSNLYLKIGRTDQALRLLEQMDYGKNTYHLHRLDLLLGTGKLYRGDEDAEVYLARFVTSNPGNTFIKDAYRKLSWLAFLDGRMEAFERYRQCISWYGETEREEDESALREAEEERVLHPGLLRARLKFDGGYYESALDILDTLSLGGIEQQFKLEYSYRKARCLHKTGALSEAVSFYMKTIELGRDEPEYYACNAALQAGKIYEEAGRRNNAEKMYRLCLELEPDSYARSLHQKAEAGLARLEGGG